MRNVFSCSALIFIHGKEDIQQYAITQNKQLGRPRACSARQPTRATSSSSKRCPPTQTPSTCTLPLSRRTQSRYCSVQISLLPPCYVTRVRKLCIPLRSVAETCVRRARVGGRSACLLLVAWQRQLEGARAAVARAARTVALLLVLLVRRGGMRVRARAPVAWAARSVRVAGSVRVGGGQKARRAARASAAGEVRDEGHRGRRARGDGAAQRQRALDKGEGLPTREGRRHE